VNLEVSSQLPSWLPAYWILATFGRVALSILVIFTVRKSDLVRRQPQRWGGFATMAALMVGWALIAMGAGSLGFFQLRPDMMFPPNILGSVLAPIVLGTLVFRHWAVFRAAILSVPAHWIIALQLFRVSGSVFLYVYLLGLVPAAFALPAGIGDLVTGVLAVPVAWGLYKKSAGARKRAVWWNWLGIAELIVLVPLGLITSESPAQMVAFDAPNFVTSYWPSVLAPSFHVPLGILMHIYSLVQLNEQPMEAKVKTRPWNLGWQAMALAAALYFIYPVLFYVISPLKTGRPIAFQIHPVIQESFQDRYLILYIHIIPSMFALLLGPLQFAAGLRARHPKVHRNLGKLYLFGGIFVGGPAGFYLAMKSFAGLSAQLGFGLQSVLLMTTGVLALAAIRRRDFAVHREWMIRNYALIFAAVTLRVNIRIFVLMGYELPDFHWLNAWLCWVPNILVAEWLIRRSQRDVIAPASAYST